MSTTTHEDDTDREPDCLDCEDKNPNCLTCSVPADPAETVEERAVRVLLAAGIAASLYHTGGGCMVAHVGDLDGSHVWITDQRESGFPGTGMYAVGEYADADDEGTPSVLTDDADLIRWTREWQAGEADAEVDSLPGKGTRVRLTRDVERFPHFTAKAGSTGIVTETGDLMRSGDVYSVRMDEPLDGAEEWDNEVCWTGDDPGSPADDFEVLGASFIVAPFGDEPLFDETGRRSMAFDSVEGAAAYAADTRKDYRKQDMADLAESMWFSIIEEPGDSLAALVSPGGETIPGQAARDIYALIDSSGEWPEAHQCGADLDCGVKAEDCSDCHPLANGGGPLPYRPTDAEIEVRAHTQLRGCESSEAVTIRKALGLLLDLADDGEGGQLDDILGEDGVELLQRLTVNPGPPKFKAGDGVQLISGEGNVIHEVESRYVNERGRWEYRVQLAYRHADRVEPFIEAELVGAASDH